MKFLRHLCVVALLLLVTTAASAAAVSDLDKRYGSLQLPNYVKHFEVNKKGEFWIHPYLQVANEAAPGIIDPKNGPYNWVIDAEGNVRINRESVNPYGRTYEKATIRPEDRSHRKPGTKEKDGHVSTLGGNKGRIGGEFLYNKATNTWIINNKSGRYSNHNPDRGPEQLLNAAARIQQVVQTNGIAWGEVHYLVRYSPNDMRPELLKSPELKFRRPEKEDIIQKDPFLVLKP